MKTGEIILHFDDDWLNIANGTESATITVVNGAAFTATAILLVAEQMVPSP